MSKQTKLSNTDIESIKKIYENLDITQIELAKLFHISQGHLSRIIAGLRRQKASENMVQ